MTTVLDASALVALLAGEPGAKEAARLAPSGAVTAVNLAEVRDRLVRSTRDAASVVAALERVIGAGLRVLSCDRSLAEAAADLRAAHYERIGSAVSLADCFAIAAALREGAALVSSDADQLRVAAKVGARISPIANSLGTVPRV